VFVALVIQHAKFMGHIILSFVACQALPYFLTLSHKWYGFWEKVIDHKVCVLIFSTPDVCNISHSEQNAVTYCHKSAPDFM